MRGVFDAVHHVRAGRGGEAHRRQAGRDAPGIRSRPARVRSPQGPDQEAGSRGRRREGRRRDRGGASRRRCHRGAVVADRGARDGAASWHRPDRLHPIRQRLPELRGSRGAQARSRHPVRRARRHDPGRDSPEADGAPFMSVLSARDIRAAIEAGSVAINPYDPQDLQPSSVDLHLDKSFRVFRNNRYAFIDVRAPQPDLTELLTVEEDEPFILHPGEFVLGQTHEWVELPDDLVARLEGKSSLGRLGLLIHSTAGYADPGWKGNLTLELSNVASLPIALYFGMRIGQISFFKMSSPVERPYGSEALGWRYQGQLEPTASAIHVDRDRDRRAREKA